MNTMVVIDGLDTNNQSDRADLRNRGYYIDDSGVYAPDGNRSGDTWSGNNSTKNTQPSGPTPPPASIGAAPPPGLSPTQAQAYLRTLDSVKQLAATNGIPSGPSGSWVVPIAMAVSKGKSIEQALSEIANAAAHTPTQGQGPAAGPVSTPAAATNPRPTTQQVGTGLPLWAWGALGIGALMVLKRH